MNTTDTNAIAELPAYTVHGTIGDGLRVIRTVRAATPRLARRAADLVGPGRTVDGIVAATKYDIDMYSYVTGSDSAEFFHFNDCHDEPLQAATHWFFQLGNTWCAVAGESLEEWWAGEGIPTEVAERFLSRPITNIPTDGTLVFWGADGSEHAVDAAAWASQRRAAA